MSNPREHHRRSIRLKGYDYAQPGAYFVTIVAWRRECLFGEIVGGVMRLNPVGRMVSAEWQHLPRHFPNLRLDAFVVMPNHVHGIIIIDSVGATRPIPVGATRPIPVGATRPIPVGATRPIPVGATRPIPVGATHPSPDETWVCKEPVPEDVLVCMDGSPLPPPPALHDNGSPLPPLHDRVNGSVRATHPSPDETWVCKEPVPEDVLICMDGSPLPPPPAIGVDGSPLPPLHDRVDGSPLPPSTYDHNDGSPLQNNPPNGPPSGSLGAMIGQFKSRATKRIWTLPGLGRSPIWQRNYYDIIIRDELGFEHIREYIHENPAMWQEDQLHPSAPPNRFNQE